jgi:ankyrin repeat protein
MDSTALMVACELKCCNEPLLELLRRGADVLQQTAVGFTALHRACQIGQPDKCKIIVEANRRSLTLCADSKLSPLVPAVLLGHVPVLQLLHTEYSADLLVRDAAGGSLLHQMATVNDAQQQQQQHHGLLQYLLSCGLDINARNHEQATPLHVATQAGNVALVQLLLDSGADPELLTSDGYNALFTAVRGGHADVTRLLLQRGMLTTATSKVRGDSPVLHIAAEHGRTAAARVLLEHGAAVNAADALVGSTALHLAAQRSYTELVRLLLQSGAALNARNKHGITPLGLALFNADVQCVRVLLAAGADTTALTTAVLTAVHAAAANTDPAVLQLVLEHNSAAALLDSTVMMCACCGRVTAVMACVKAPQLKLLLAAGADVHVITDTGGTALHVAAAHNYSAPVLCLLIKAGVDLRAVNASGKTAAQVAADRGNTLAAALLTRAAAGP